MAATHPQDRPTIGVLAGWQFYRTATNLSYLAPVFRGMVKAAQTEGCNLLLGCGMGPSASPSDPLRPAWPVPASDHDFVPIGPWNTDGLIVAVPLHSPTRSATIQDLRASGYPILFVGSGEPGPAIVANNTGGIREALGHLVAHGHRQIAFIAGSPTDLRGDTGERLRAYQAGCAAYDLDLDPRRVAYGRHVYDGGYAAMQQILDAGAPFTALLASNDESALGAMQALREAGRAIPQDVAVIGFDNRPEGAVQAPGLSSIHVPLFNIGGQAVELLFQHITGTAALPDMVQVDTHLVVRESCGCGTGSDVPGGRDPDSARPLRPTAEPPAPLARTIATTILNQAHSLSEADALALGGQLVETFAASLQADDPTPFQAALAAILQRTAAGGDDPHIWQAAITLLETGTDPPAPPGSPAAGRVADLLTAARVTISAQMWRHHQQYVVDERWTSSRLSLLTAHLLTALDEQQIYEILATHLPAMSIQTALLGLFEADGADPVAWTTLRDTLHPAQPLVRVPSRAFPPAPLFPAEQPLILTLIPLVDQSRQLGFMVFDAAHFDLYGSIVQQVGGALNTARLYRQATEGRRLAEEANGMKSRFLSTISHELRMPLNLIVGLSSMVLRDSEEREPPLPEPTRNDLERIHAYAQHLGGLIGDVIDLATSDAGQLRLNTTTVDLGQTLRLVAESGSQLAAAKGLTWDAQLPASGPWVWGDPTRLRQVALNLITNAVKFTTSGGVRLWLETGPDAVTVRVQDTGLGIPQAEQQAIFDDFRQSARSVARGYSGLGLGLAISKRLVHLHGGTLTLASPGDAGSGATFSFTLPTVPPPLAPARPPPEGASAQPTVLVLTNQPSTSEPLRLHLQGRGFPVQTVPLARGAEWQARLDAECPNTIILDVSTDSALSWEALQAIKSRPTLAGIPVLFFSSAQREGAVLELEYLTKPIDLAELTRALDHHWLMTDTGQPTHTILVVDDDPHTLEMHARIVQAHSSANRVLKARDGQEALALLHREIVDLLLLDLQMPEMDGFAVLAAMREMDSARPIPVIVVTGQVLTEADMARLDQGVAAVLGKGLFSIEETVAHISAALEHKRRLSSEAQRLVRAAMAYLHAHYSEAITRREIAQHVGITEDHLTFCFRQELGTTPIEYLQRYRINQAKHLLKASPHPITRVAREVGFADSGYFSRIFRRETGLSPEQFRRT